MKGWKTHILSFIPILAVVLAKFGVVIDQVLLEQYVDEIVLLVVAAMNFLRFVTDSESGLKKLVKK